MDPAMITALVSAGIRLATQAVGGASRIKQQLSELEQLLVTLHTEGREPTAAEVNHFVAAAVSSDNTLTDAIARLEAAVAARHGG